VFAGAYAGIAVAAIRARAALLTRESIETIAGLSRRGFGLVVKRAVVRLLGRHSHEQTRRRGEVELTETDRQGMRRFCSVHIAIFGGVILLLATHRTPRRSDVSRS
jgi:hypothetical protein